MTTNDVRNADMNENAVPSDAELRDVLDVFKTMSDPTRMRIILAIAKGPITVTDLAAMLDLGQSAVSHQLRLLKQARLVVGIAPANRFIIIWWMTMFWKSTR